MAYRSNPRPQPLVDPTLDDLEASLRRRARIKRIVGAARVDEAARPGRSRLENRRTSEHMTLGRFATKTRRAIRLALPCVVLAFTACTTPTPRLHWLARDPRTGQPVLLHTDATSPDKYTVAMSWSTALPGSSEVLRSAWTECYRGDVSRLPMLGGSLETMSMETDSSGIVSLALGFDLTFPDAPARYRCGTSGPTWLR